MKYHTSLLVSFFFCLSAFCQTHTAADSAGAVYGQPHGRSSAVRPSSFIVPSLMVAYGIAAINVKPLQQLNRNIHDRIWSGSVQTGRPPESFLQWTPAVAVYALNLAGIKGEHNLVDRSIIYAMAVGIQASAVYGIKKISRETRPNGEGQEAFPSGHTSNAFAAAEFLRREYRYQSPWYGVAGYTVAAATGVLRMYHNKHWFGDVVAGAGVGIISTDLAYLLYPWLKNAFTSRKGNTTLISPMYEKGGFGFSLVRML